MEFDKSRNEFSIYRELQSKIISIDENVIEKLFDFIELSIFQTESGLKSLTHIILYLIDYLPQKIIILISFIMNLSKTSTFSNLPKLIFNEMVKIQPNCSRLYFLYQAVNINLIPFDVILPQIESFEHFFWFAPIIEENNNQLFEYFMNQRKEKQSILLIKELKNDDWKQFNKLASKGMNHTEIASLIRKDDIENLEKVPYFDIKMELPFSPFESVDILNHGCSILHYSIYYNSEKCYDFLLEKGADPFETDFNGYDSIDFAIAGECFSFLEKFLESSFCENKQILINKVNQAILCSVKYHRNVLFESLMIKYSEFSDISFIFLTASKYDNSSIILKCIENKVDINCSNDYDENALIIAARNNHKELVEFLLSFPSIDPTHVDHYGQNALICAAERENIEIVKILIKDSRIDINAFDKDIFLFYFLMGIQQFII